MKAATLLSRCGEKDLYDLKWLLENAPAEFNINNLMILAEEIDNGVNLQSLHTSIGGTKLREEACDFSLNSKITAHDIFKEIRQFQKQLLLQLELQMKDEPVHPLREMFNVLKR